MQGPWTSHPRRLPCWLLQTRRGRDHSHTKHPFLVDPKEWWAMCCPDNYYCQSGGIHRCGSTRREASIRLVVLCGLVGVVLVGQANGVLVSGRDATVCSQQSRQGYWLPVMPTVDPPHPEPMRPSLDSSCRRCDCCCLVPILVRPTVDCHPPLYCHDDFHKDCRFPFSIVPPWLLAFQSPVHHRRIVPIGGEQRQTRPSHNCRHSFCVCEL